jgi:hypothetical protein
MFECLIAANSNADVVTDGIESCFQSYGRLNTTRATDIAALLAITNSLLEVNGIEGYNTITFRSVCEYLEGEMCITVLRLLLIKYNEEAGLRVTDEEGNLPIHIAVYKSTLDVVTFLLQAYPESVNDIAEYGENLLHIILGCDHIGKVARVQYFCDRCPGLLHMKNDYDMTPLQDFLINHKTDLSTVAIMSQSD